MSIINGEAVKRQKRKKYPHDALLSLSARHILTGMGWRHNEHALWAFQGTGWDGVLRYDEETNSLAPELRVHGSLPGTEVMRWRLAPFPIFPDIQRTISWWQIQQFLFDSRLAWHILMARLGWSRRVGRKTHTSPDNTVLAWILVDPAIPPVTPPKLNEHFGAKYFADLMRRTAAEVRTDRFFYMPDPRDAVAAKMLTEELKGEVITESLKELYEDHTGHAEESEASFWAQKNLTGFMTFSKVMIPTGLTLLGTGISLSRLRHPTWAVRTTRRKIRVVELAPRHEQHRIAHTFPADERELGLLASIYHVDTRDPVEYEMPFEFMIRCMLDLLDKGLSSTYAHLHGYPTHPTTHYTQEMIQRV